MCGPCWRPRRPCPQAWAIRAHRSPPTRGGRRPPSRRPHLFDAAHPAPGSCCNGLPPAPGRPTSSPAPNPPMPCNRRGRPVAASAGLEPRARPFLGHVSRSQENRPGPRCFPFPSPKWGERNLTTRRAQVPDMVAERRIAPGPTGRPGPSVSRSGPATRLGRRIGMRIVSPFYPPRRVSPAPALRLWIPGVPSRDAHLPLAGQGGRPGDHRGQPGSLGLVLTAPPFPVPSWEAARLPFYTPRPISAAALNPRGAQTFAFPECPQQPSTRPTLVRGGGPRFTWSIQFRSLPAPRFPPRTARSCHTSTSNPTTSSATTGDVAVPTRGDARAARARAAPRRCGRARSIPRA